MILVTINANRAHNYNYWKSTRHITNIKCSDGNCACVGWSTCGEVGFILCRMPITIILLDILFLAVLSH